jgi:photosystem I reaction center subunit XII
MVVTPDLLAAPVMLPTTLAIAANSGAITDGQIFTALVVALVAAGGALALGRNLYL